MAKYGSSKSKLTQAVKVGKAKTGSFGKRVSGVAGRTATGGRGGSTDQAVAAGSRAYGRSAPGTSMGGAGGGKTTGSVVETTTPAGGTPRPAPAPRPKPSPAPPSSGGTFGSPGPIGQRSIAVSRTATPAPAPKPVAKAQPKAPPRPVAKRKVVAKAPAKAAPRPTNIANRTGAKGAAGRPIAQAKNRPGGSQGSSSKKKATTKATKKPTTKRVGTTVRKYL